MSSFKSQSRLVSACAVLCYMIIFPGSGRAQDDVESLKKHVREMRQQLQEMVRRIEELEKKKSEEAKPLAEPPHTFTQSSGLGSLGRSLFQSVNPEIGVVADIVGKSTQSNRDAAGNDRISFREAEIVFGGFIDPFARYDLAVTFSDAEKPAIEEGFLTFFGLPLNSKFRIGQYRNKIGKINLIDRNALPFVNEPLVVENFFGPEGFINTGAQITSFIPNPVLPFFELTAEVIDGGNDQSFSGNKRFPGFVAHARTFLDLTDFSNLEIGLSNVLGTRTVKGSNGKRRGPLANILGGDVTFRRKVTVSDDFKWVTEWYTNFRGREGTFFGIYTYPSYRFHPHWEAGLRLDWVRGIKLRGKEAFDEITSRPGRNIAVAPVLTYHLSEFNRIRFQYQHTDLRGKKDNAFFLQFRAQIGTDRHALQ